MNVTTRLALAELLPALVARREAAQRLACDTPFTIEQCEQELLAANGDENAARARLLLRLAEGSR